MVGVLNFILNRIILNFRGAEYVELYLTKNTSLVWRLRDDALKPFSVFFPCSGLIKKHNTEGQVLSSFNKSSNLQKIGFSSINDDFYVFMLENCESGIFPEQIFSLDIYVYNF
jgi:hypothetical protein